MFSTNLVQNLKPNRNLIDSFFDRYRLMNQKFPVKKLELREKGKQYFIFYTVKLFLNKKIICKKCFLLPS